ncbi:unknown [Helicoverpa armigera nucleopolyhedrovirus]|uniref:Uncharacterized protein n=5 Tax=Alphabaculovirus helarmigerae TaxID=3047947 RepID=Q9IFJ3_9ABAC|nr:hypothetical protein HanGV4gp122 [Helicoverpa armigera nucleopolyhedrovirus G4]NP_203678.1 hypothetical protein [Helicoverpa armigera nucleopolyhedrovirus]AAG17383.1 Orf63-like protein [Helicoverpa zea single nucleopolyhedrovirus]AEN04044.1 hypothetical protein [Helicoverpa armigera NPV strain Australia]AXR98107.1 hypothetical protein [Helicoverpa assulta nucleopolyhedrovirus]BAG74693.1 hypothetical protein [Helicoverpa armigera NPV NNg1]AAF78936.1 unknown [Helicoverpa armigera nucleopolyh
MYKYFLYFLHLSGLHEEMLHFINQYEKLHLFQDDNVIKSIVIESLRRVNAKAQECLRPNAHENVYEIITLETICKCFLNRKFHNPYVRGCQKAAQFLLQDCDMKTIVKFICDNHFDLQAMDNYINDCLIFFDERDINDAVNLLRCDCEDIMYII